MDLRPQLLNTALRAEPLGHRGGRLLGEARPLERGAGHPGDRGLVADDRRLHGAADFVVVAASHDPIAPALAAVTGSSGGDGGDPPRELVARPWLSPDEGVKARVVQDAEDDVCVRRQQRLQHEPSCRQHSLGARDRCTSGSRARGFRATLILPYARWMGDAPSLPPEDRETKRRLPELLAERGRLRGRQPMMPHAGSVDGEQTTGGGKSGRLRAAIFGINDGLVSNVALIMGFAGADANRGVILLAGISGLLAGAFSMGAGEYISMKVQREVLERMIHLEAHELHGDPEAERAELAEIYRHKGLSDELSEQVATEL